MDWKPDGNDVIAFSWSVSRPVLVSLLLLSGEGLAENLIEKQDPQIRGLTELLHEGDWQEAWP